MATKIEWARNPDGTPGETWNVTGGCKEISRACGQCYAKGFSWRHAHNPRTAEAYAGLVEKGEAGLRWTGKIALFEDRLARPCHWRKPRLIFVDSCADLFYKTPHDFLDEVFAVIRDTPRHFYLILTKYATRALSYFTQYRAAPLGSAWPPSNVGIGVTVEHPDYYDRLGKLSRIPRAVRALRFVSYSPAMGRLPWSGALSERPAIGWLIAEGQSGPRAAPSHPNWFRNARRGCAARGIPFFFKGWGAWTPHRPVIEDHPASAAVCVGTPFIDGVTMYRVGKKHAGAMLDGHLHHEYPEIIKRHFEEQR